MRVNAITVKPFKNQQLDQRQARASSTNRTEPEWENVTTISETVGKGDPRVRCNHCLKEYNGGFIRIRGRLLANPKSGVSMCYKCPPAVRSMLAGKEETAAAEKKHMAQLQQASAAADAGGLPAGLCSRP